MAAKRKSPRRKSPSKRKRCGSPTGGSVTQSLVFSKTKHARGKSRWTKASVKAWAKAHGKRYGKVDETESTFRLRQFDPAPVCDYRMQPFGSSGILGVLEMGSKVPRHVRLAVEKEIVLPKKRGKSGKK